MKCALLQLPLAFANDNQILSWAQTLLCCSRPIFWQTITNNLWRITETPKSPHAQNWIQISLFSFVPWEMAPTSPGHQSILGTLFASSLWLVIQKIQFLQRQLTIITVAYTISVLLHASPYPQCFTDINLFWALGIIQILSSYSIPTASFQIQGLVISPLDENCLQTGVPHSGHPRPLVYPPHCDRGPF